jgi:hypothetical protein
VNNGELVAIAATNGERVAADVVTNGEIVGSAANDAPVLTVRVGDGVSILWNTVYRNSASSSAS